MYAFPHMTFAPTGYCACHAPVQMNATAVTNGYKPLPLDEGYLWADLSCGDGVSAATMAAANPNGTFYALGDGRKGKKLAKAAGLTNITWLQGKLADLAEDALPPLDFVVFDGGMVAMNEAERRQALARVSACVKLGGIALVGYHAMPGFAAMMPLRDVVHSLTIKYEESPVTRVHEALYWLDSVNFADLGFLADHPGVRRRLASYADLPNEIAATELFEPFLKPLHFAQVSLAFEAEGINFAGNSALHLNMVDLAVPPSLRPVLNHVKSRREFETLRDMLRNTFYRRDIYVRGRAVSDMDAFWAQHEAMLVGISKPISSVDFGGFSINLEGFPFSTLADGVADAPRYVHDIPDLLPSIARDAVRTALAAGLVQPCVPVEPPASDAAASDTIHIPNRFNRVIMAQAASFEETVPVVAPVLGGAVLMDKGEAMVLAAVAETQCDFSHAKDAVVAYLLELLELQDQGPAAANHLESMVKAGLAQLTPERLAELARLGVLTA